MLRAPTQTCRFERRCEDATDAPDARTELAATAEPDCTVGPPARRGSCCTVRQMIGESVLSGYLLEEALAWLMRSTGYKLLISDQQDSAELVSEGTVLKVRGRGALHQADVLGEFMYTPPFSLPIRMFLEAKCYRTKLCDLEVVRNAHGVVHDINQNYALGVGSSRPRRRYQYLYALCSTSGFSAEAQQYALAHQLSLVDISGESYAWLRNAVNAGATRLRRAAVVNRVVRYPLTWTRAALRMRLDTGIGEVPVVPPGAPRFASAAQSAIDEFTQDLRHHQKMELLLGFPAAPFILPLAALDKRPFLEYVANHPTHRVSLRRSGIDEQAEWVVSPQDRYDYQLRFTLPREIERWISEDEEHLRKRTRVVKTDYLAAITVYYLHHGGVRACQLVYEPGRLRHG